MTLFDVVVNVPLADEVSYILNADVVFDFLERNLKGKPVYSITTDGRKWYRKIVKNLKAIHQLCGFHFLKKVTEDADYYFNSKSLSDTEKIRLAIFVSAIREVFCSFTEEEFLEKLENVYAMKDAVPSLMKNHIEKLVKDVDLYTNHLLNPQIL